MRQAKTGLKQAATTTVGSISQQVIEAGGDLAYDLVFSTEWEDVLQGAGLISSNIANLLKKIKEGVGALLRRIVNAVVKTLINVYDKILALLGKDVEDQARQRSRNGWKLLKKRGRSTRSNPW